MDFLVRIASTVESPVDALLQWNLSVVVGRRRKHFARVDQGGARLIILRYLLALLDGLDSGLVDCLIALIIYIICR